MVSSAYKLLGYILRTTRDFSTTNPVKTLFFSFVRSKLEYGSIIWSPYYKIHIDHIESVQRRLAKALWFRTDGIYPVRGFPHDQLLRRFSLTCLDRRRECISQLFLHKLVNSNILCEDLLCKLNFRIPNVNSRNTDTFYLPPFRTNILKFSPVNSMCSIYNYCNNAYDIFNCNFAAIRRHFYQN